MPKNFQNYNFKKCDQINIKIRQNYFENFILSKFGQEVLKICTKHFENMNKNIENF
jgi:hypothetical protein